MPHDAQCTKSHPILQHTSAGTTNRVPRIPLREISLRLAFGSEGRMRIVKYKFTFYTVLLKKQMQHAREFCKCSLRSINFFESHAVISEKAGFIFPINVSERSSNHRALCLIRC